MHGSGLVELEAVLAVARHGGFRAAATAMGMSRSALSATVAGLEARLGVRLFNRTTRSVATTEAGEQFVARIAPALADIRGAMEATNELRDTPAGTLRLNSSVGAAQMIFAPVVLEYLRRYPDMKVDIVTERRLVDIVAEGFDAGIRLAEAVPRDMVAVPMGGEQRMVVVASPQYLRTHPAPRVPDDLMAHRCVRWRFASGTIYRWESARHGESMTLDVPGPITLDEPLLMLEGGACRRGHCLHGNVPRRRRPGERSAGAAARRVVAQLPGHLLVLPEPALRAGGSGGPSSTWCARRSSCRSSSGRRLPRGLRLLQTRDPGRPPPRR